MRARNYVIGGLCSAVIVAQGASTPGGNDPALGDDGLDVVPEENLKDMRGGVDLGNLVGYFAIDRVVEVDGQVVAKMQIVVSNLDKLSTGGMPTVSVSGPLSQLVQVMNGSAGGSGADGVPAAVVAAAKTLAEPHSTQAAGGAAGSSGSSAPSAVSASTGRGVTGSSGAAGGAGAVAAAAGQAVGLANASAGTSAGSVVTASSGSGNASSQFQSTVTVVPQGAAGAAAPGSTGAAAQAAGNATDNITKIIPIGNTGQFVVVSNLPNAGALATAVQNEVRGTLIQTQTTITARLNSLTLLNSMALANAIRQQISLPIGH
jgi:hypothetical protein